MFFTRRSQAVQPTPSRVPRSREGIALVVLLAGFIGVFATSPVFSAPTKVDFKGDRVTVTSDKSFDHVSGAITSMVAKNGMMVMAQVDQGKMLSMTGLRLEATLFLIGSPTVGKKLFEQDRAVGLYVPLRLFVYGGEDGKTYISYDKPSSLLGQFEKKEVAMVAQMLDKKLMGLATMAAQ